MSNETKDLVQRIDKIEEAVGHLEKQMNMVAEILERVVSQISTGAEIDLPSMDLFDSISESFKDVTSKLVTPDNDTAGDA